MEERLSQQRAPVFEALKRFQRMRVVPFDVPGHKRGKGTPELTAFLGEQCMSVDVNSMKPLDNLCHPVSVIKEAEELAAQAFGAENAFLHGERNHLRSAEHGAGRLQKGEKRSFCPGTSTAASSTRWCSAAPSRCTSTRR